MDKFALELKNTLYLEKMFSFKLKYNEYQKKSIWDFFK